MIIKKIQPTKILYNLRERRIVNEKTKDCIYFDSISEYDCFLMLDRLFSPENWDILIHQKLSAGQVSWKLDFTIKSKTANYTQWLQLKRLAETMNGCSINIPPTQIYIEYKGYQDENFSTKMRTIKSSYPDLSKTIILCSRYDGAFGFWDEKNHQPSCHFISSCYTLEKMIKTII